MRHARASAVHSCRRVSIALAGYTIGALGPVDDGRVETVAYGAFGVLISCFMRPPATYLCERIKKGAFGVREVELEQRGGTPERGTAHCDELGELPVPTGHATE